MFPKYNWFSSEDSPSFLMNLKLHFIARWHFRSRKMSISQTNIWPEKDKKNNKIYKTGNWVGIMLDTIQLQLWSFQMPFWMPFWMPQPLLWSQVKGCVENVFLEWCHIVKVIHIFWGKRAVRSTCFKGTQPRSKGEHPNHVWVIVESQWHWKLETKRTVGTESTVD